MKPTHGTLVSAFIIAACSAVPTAAFPAAKDPAPQSTNSSLAWKFEYGVGDRLVKSIDPAGRATELKYEFDAAKCLRKLVQTCADGSGVTREADATGRLTRMTDGAGTVSYGYDDLGRLNRVERQGTPAIAYTHDALDRLTSLQVGDFYRMDYSYDFLGRLASVKTPAGMVTYDYQTGLGEVVRSLPNGVKTIWKRLPNGELAEITHGFCKKPDAKTYSVLAKYIYTHGPDGRIAAIREQSGEGKLDLRYGYDTMGRLVQATGPGGQIYSYAYDRVGNRTKATATGRSAQSCAYDWAGRLTSVDGKPCQYDACGNLTNITLNGTDRQYKYHPDGRLAEAKVGNEAAVQYLYDGNGRLISRKGPAGGTRFTPDPLSSIWQPLVMEEPGGAKTLVIWDGNTPLAIVSNGKTEWLLTDHLGSVRLVADAMGEVRQQCRYDPFGVPEKTDKTDTTFAGFAGLLCDAQGACIQTLARIYLPELGQFLQPDPQKRIPSAAANDGSLYAYCGGEPVNFVDLDGAYPAALDTQRIWWDIFWNEYRKNVLDTLDATRAKESLAMYSASYLANARGSGWAAAGTATLLDVIGGYIPGKPASENQSLAQLAWTVALTGGSSVLKAAAMRSGSLAAFSGHIAKGLSGINYGRTTGSAIINASEGRHVDAALDLVSMGLNLRAVRADSLRNTRFPSGYQYELPLFDDTKRASLLYQSLQAPEAHKNLFALSKFSRSSINHAVKWSSQPRDSVPPFVDARPSPVGGVYLGGAGGAIAGLGVIKGINVDANGNLALVGEDAGDIKLPPLRLDDVVTVFRSVYLNGEGPTVTIDPNPEDRNKSPMVIVHSEATRDTYVGWILYQADRLMKGYTLGRDNQTEKDVVSGVPGYAEVLDKIFFGSDDLLRNPKEGNWERFWIVPAAASRFEGTRRTLTWFDVPLKVKTQKMKWVGGNMEDDLTGKSSPGAMAFTAWFTKNYEGISNEQYLPPPPAAGISAPVPVFTELRQIAMMTAIAEKLRDQGVPLPFWMRDYEVKRVPFETTTPALAVTRKKADGEVIRTARIFGGVDLSPETKDVRTYAAADAAKAAPEVRAELGRSVKLAERLEQAVAAVLPPVGAIPLAVHKVEDEKHDYQAVSIPGAASLALNPCRLQEVDLVVPFAGGRDIRLARSYNSFFNPKGPWGKGWTMDLPRLREIRIPGSREGGKVTYTTGYELLTPLNSSYARFKEIRPVKGLGGGKLQVPDAEGPFYGLADATLDCLKDEKPHNAVAAVVVYLKDGGEWYFTTTGDFVAAKDGPQMTIYERAADGRVSRIVGLLENVLIAKLDLEYHQGILAKAVGLSLEDPKAKAAEISYSYDPSGRLADVASADGKVGYTYRNSWVASVSWTDMKEGAAPEIWNAFEYNERGQVVAEQRGKLTTRHEIAAVPGGIETSVAPAADGSARVFARYDTHMRVLETTGADGTNTAWTYPSDGSVKTTVTTPDQRKITVADSADGRLRTVRAAGSPSLESRFDAGGKLTRLAENNRTLLTQQWRQDGQLAEAETEAQGVSYQYGRHGLLASIIAHPPAAGTQHTEWQETAVDRRGAPTAVKDATGLQLQFGYDASGALASAIQKTPAGDLGYTVERDAKGQVRTVKSSWGDTSYGYAQDGGLARIESTRDGKSAAVEMAAGLVRKVTGADGGVTTCSYHEKGPHAGAPERIHCADGLEIAYQYSPDGGGVAADLGGVRTVAFVSTDGGRRCEYRISPAGAATPEPAEQAAPAPTRSAPPVSPPTPVPPKAETPAPTAGPPVTVPAPGSGSEDKPESAFMKNLRWLSGAKATAKPKK